MRVLLANLRFFYQCRALWLLYTLIAICVAVVLWLRLFTVDAGLHTIVPFASASVIAPLGVLVLVSIIGLIVAVMQMEAASKPFVFCLPEHRSAFRRLVFLVGAVATGVVTPLVWPAAGVPSEFFHLRFFCTGLVAYFVGVGFGLVLRNAAVGIAFAPLLLFASMSPLLDVSRRCCIVPSVVPSVALSVATATAMWLWLGKPNLFRRRCGRPWLGFSGLLNHAEGDRFRQAVASIKSRRASASRADGFLLRTMRRCEQSTVAKHIWSTLYAWLSPGGGGRSLVIQMSLLCPVSAIVAWDSSEMGPFFIANASLWAGLAIRNLPLRSHLLMAGGRRERFFSTLVVTAVLGCIVTLSVVLVFAVVTTTGWHSPLWHPSTAVSGLPRQPMNAGLAVLLTAIFPISRLLETVVARRGVVKLVQMALLMGIVFFSVFAESSWPTVPLVPAACGLALSWITWLHGIHRFAMRSDLVSR